VFGCVFFSFVQACVHVCVRACTCVCTCVCLGVGLAENFLMVFFYINNSATPKQTFMSVCILYVSMSVRLCQYVSCMLYVSMSVRLYNSICCIACPCYTCLFTYTHMLPLHINYCAASSDTVVCHTSVFLCVCTQGFAWAIQHNAFQARVESIPLVFQVRKTFRLRAVPVV